MESFFKYFYSLPVIYFGAFGFYISLLCLLLPKFRHKFQQVYSLPPPSTHKVIPVLDTFRGLAALWVATFHAWQWLRPFHNPVQSSLGFITMGDKSVPMFVVLSGFLVYRSVKTCVTTKDLKRYYLRRLLRIYPLYFITTVAAFVFAFNTLEYYSLSRVVSEIFMLEAFQYPHFSNPPVWSLYVEELFYLTLPIWAVATEKRPLFSAVLAFFIFALPGSLETPRSFDLMKYFFVGIILAELLATEKIYKLSTFLAPLFLILGGIILYWDINKIESLSKLGTTLEFLPVISQYLRSIRSGTYTIDLGLGMGLVILGSILFRPVNRFLSFYPFRFLGIISYSIFMWHGFIIVCNTGRVFNGKGHLEGVSKLVGEMSAFHFSLLYPQAFIFFAALSFYFIEKKFAKLRPT